jgi:amino acid transporter
MAFRREIGLLGLTFIAVGGVLGSGWLFSPLLASQLAGPAAILSWTIGAVAMMFLALTFAEITAMFPVAGGLARIPQFSHGRLLSTVLGWSAWAGYCTTAPIEVEAALRYASTYLPALHGGQDESLSFLGILASLGLLAVMTLLNAFGVALFAKVNTSLTWVKLVFPVVFVFVIVADRFDASNFTAHGGFAPLGLEGIFAAVASGGIAFAFIGFRHAIDMAGETRNPQKTIPRALILSILICFLVYGAIQIVFVGGLSKEALAGGWSSLDAAHSLGPLGALATSVGILWLVSMLNVAAVLSPLGGGLVSTGSNGRLAMAMSENGVFPRLFAKLNSAGVPLHALVLNFVVGGILLFTTSFKGLVALNSSALVLSFMIGPVAVLSFRKVLADYPRPFSLPGGAPVAMLTFIAATLMVYWSGWDTMWRLLLLLAVGLLILSPKLRAHDGERLHARGALWLVPYLIVLGGIALLGGYGNGLDWIQAPWDSLLVAVLSVPIFFLAARSHLPRAGVDRELATELQFAKEDYGHADAAESALAEEVEEHPRPPKKEE